MINTSINRKKNTHLATHKLEPIHEKSDVNVRPPLRPSKKYTSRLAAIRFESIQQGSDISHSDAKDEYNRVNRKTAEINILNLVDFDIDSEIASIQPVESMLCSKELSPRSRSNPPEQNKLAPLSRLNLLPENRGIKKAWSDSTLPIEIEASIDDIVSKSWIPTQKEIRPSHYSIAQGTLFPPIEQKKSSKTPNSIAASPSLFKS